MKITILIILAFALASCSTTASKDPFDVMLDAQMLKIANSPL
jgi:hypothetical protein